MGWFGRICGPGWTPGEFGAGDDSKAVRSVWLSWGQQGYKVASKKGGAIVEGQICRKGGWGADIGVIDEV